LHYFIFSSPDPFMIFLYCSS